MTFHVMSSTAYVRGGTGRAGPLSFTDFSHPSLNERIIWAGANLIISYPSIGDMALWDHDADIILILEERMRKVGGRK